MVELIQGHRLFWVATKTSILRLVSTLLHSKTQLHGSARRLNCFWEEGYQQQPYKLLSKERSDPLGSGFQHTVPCVFLQPGCRKIIVGRKSTQAGHPTAILELLQLLPVSQIGARCTHRCRRPPHRLILGSHIEAVANKIMSLC
jgi:hypothetical protein